MSCYKQLILKKIVRNASRHFQMSLVVSLIAQAINYLQVLAVIFYAGFASRQGFQQGFFSLVSLILSVSGHFELFDPFQKMSTGVVTLVVCFGYILCQCIFIIYVLFKLAHHDEVKTRTSRIFFVGLILHTKVIFFPIQFFFVKLLSSFFSCDDYNDSELIGCQDWAFTLALLGFILNLALAFLREVYLHQIQRDEKNFFAAKSNNFKIITLLQKAISLPLVYFCEESRSTVLALNLLACLIQAFILQTKLPLYDLAMLKLTISMNLIAICLVPISFVRLYYQNEHILSLLLVIMIPLVLRISFIFLNRLLHAIAEFKVKTPEHAAHIPVLIEKYTDQHAVLLTHLSRYQEGAFYFYGLISKEGINVESLKDAEFVSNLKRQLYLATIEHCTQLWQRYPNNELLVLTMAHIYLENLRDAPQAMKLLRKFGKRNLSRAGQSAIEAIYAELENLLTQNSKNDSKPEYLTYLKYQEVGAALRREIYNEIGEHIKFWDELSQESISDTSLALIAEKISVSNKKIKQLWQSNFTHFGASFSSIYLLYGVYLDSIRGAPHLGLSLIKKGRDFLMHKRALRDVSTDIITDNNAVIVASIEPEKMGEITDASTSVGHIFNVQREKLIGMKINCVLPKIVADKHDIFIQRYYNSFRYNLDKKITSYAKTLDGNYFPVESTLRLYPSIQNGLSVLSYIKKSSNTLSLMILNQNGKIIECSKDLQKLLLINTDKEAPNINRICPDLIKFNQAFNLIYLNRTDSMTDNNIVKPSIFCEKGISDTRSGHFLSSREDSVDPLNPTRVETMDFLVSPKERTSPKKTSLIPFSKEAAQTMCANLKEGKRLRYYPVGVNILTYQENIEFVTQLEPYEVDGEFFKILRLRRVKVPSASQISVGASSRRLSKCQSNIKLTSLRGDEAPLRTDENTPSEDPKCILLKPADQEDDSQESSISIDDQIDDEEDGVAGLSKLRRQISKQNPSTITTSTRKTLTIIKQLDDLFSRETSNVEKKMSWQVIYSTVIILSVLLCVSLVFTQSSLREMERDVVLLDAVDTRLYNSAIAWYYLLIIYLRPAGIRTSGSADALYQSRLLTSSQDMLSSNQILSTLVDELEDKDTVSVFYQKDITFWQPFNGQVFAPDKLNSFVASQVLYTTMMKVAKYNGSLATIGGLEEPLFAINNTANDYFTKAEEDTTTVEEVVANTVNKNIKLLDILLVIQCLCLVRVFGEILLFMRTVYLSHKKMLEAIIKIKRSHIAGRADQVKKIAEYLKNDLELNKLDKIPMQNVNAHAKKVVDQAKLPEKKFVLKGMILLMIKYASIAWLLMCILCILCIVSFYDSTSAFSSLDKINQKLIVTHNLGSYITMLLPQYYYLTIFQNNTSYMIHNSPPEDRVLRSLGILGGANQQLISVLNDGDNGISDPVIQKALMDNVCDFLDTTTKRYCVSITNQNSFGLLGINSMYYQGISPLMSSYMMNSTLSNAITVFNALTPFTNFFPIVLRNSYAFLSSYFLTQFHQQTSNKLDETYTYFVLILLLNFVSAIIIKTITLKKFKVLDIAPRKIMHLIPYNVILDNRIMIFYLKKGFGQELGNLKNFL